MQHRQFPQVSTRYGAPMGRGSYGAAPSDGQTVRLFRVRLDAQGYDEGGAYWGTGAPIYCATDGANYREFVRASSRDKAAQVLGIASRLRRKIAPH